MAKVSVVAKINMPQLYRELDLTKNARVIQRQARPIIRQVINLAAEDLRDEFENHPVTIELDGGAEAANISGTLSGFGNLFSYIGFKRRTKPTAPIRRILKRKGVFALKYKNKALVISLRGPSLEEIYEKTPLPWATDSWARRIELGIAGFGQYLLLKSPTGPKRRSGEAIQIGQTLRGGSFQKTSYLSEMIDRYHRKIGI